MIENETHFIVSTIQNTAFGIRAQPVFPRIPSRALPSCEMASDSPTPLGEALQQLARAQRARLAELLAPHGLHAGQDALLWVVWQEPGMRQAEIARRLGVEPPTVTRMLQRLERSGFVERRPDPSDARLVRVHPTPRARLLEAAVRRAWDDVEAEIAARLGAARAEELGRLAREAADALKRREDPSAS